MNSPGFYSVLLSGSMLLGMNPNPGKSVSVNANETIGTMQVEGTKQGIILGRPGAGAGDPTAGVNLISFKMGSAAPLDPAPGAVKGARPKHLIVVTREIDAASPKIYQAFTGNEILKSVVIKLTKKKPDSKPEVTRTVTLTDVIISKVRRDGPDLNPLHLEELSYSYRLILVQNADGSTSTTDDVTAHDQ